MKSLIIDDTLREKLALEVFPINLCDSTGRSLGCFIPKADPSQFEPVTPLSPEELERRMRSTEWYTTEEVLRHLESL